MAGNVNAINGAGITGVFCNPYEYGFDDLDMNCGSYGSIFDGYNGMNGFGMMPMMPIGGVGTGKSYFDNMKDYQKFYIDYNVDQQNMQRNADLRINASIEGINGTALVLHDKIKQNEQDQIQKALRAYVNSVAFAYGPGSEKQIKSRALSLYQQITGKSLIQDLRENSHSSFTQGLLQSLTFSTTHRHSAEDNISMITGQPVGSGDKASHNLGRIVGAAGVGLAAGGLTKALAKGSVQASSKLAAGIAKEGVKASSKLIAKFAKLGGKPGLVGLIAGGVSLALSFLTGKVST